MAYNGLVRWSFGLVFIACLTASTGCGPSRHLQPARDVTISDGALAEGGGVVLLVSRELRQPAEVIAIVDIPVARNHDRRALAESEGLALSADAVIGIEYRQHGDAGRLSGLAVRALP